MQKRRAGISAVIIKELSNVNSYLEQYQIVKKVEVQKQATREILVKKRSV